MVDLEYQGHASCEVTEKSNVDITEDIVSDDYHI